MELLTEVKKGSILIGNVSGMKYLILKDSDPHYDGKSLELRFVREDHTHWRKQAFKVWDRYDGNSTGLFFHEGPTKESIAWADECLATLKYSTD